MASRLTINTNSLNVPWQLGTQYRIALAADVVKEPSNNKKGNPVVASVGTFTTNATVPTLSSSSPTNDAFDVENNTTVQLTFNRNIEAGSGNIRLYQVEVGGADILLYTYNMGDPAYVTISNTTITLKTTGLLEADSAFYLVFDSNAVRDLDNFNYVGSRTAKTITANGNAVLNNTVTKWPGVDSVIFDGAGDYLSVPSSADFGYGTGAFEISAWIRPTTASQTSVIVDHRPTATEGLYPTLRLQSGVLQYYTNSAVRITGTTITPNTWTFVQVARFAGTTRLYVNGGQVGADYTDSNTYPTAAVKIGVNGVDLSAGFTGYMSDILIKKAPIGLGGFRTRSSVNDDYTVLAIVGSLNDFNNTIFFDTQEEALGFPSLSASITGAFTPTFSIRYTATFITVMGVSATIACANSRLRRATITMNSENAFALSARVDYSVIQTFKSVFTQSVNFDRFRAGTSNLSTFVDLGFPWQNVYNFDGGLSFNTQFGHKIHLNSANQLLVGSNPSSGIQSPKFYELSNYSATLSGTQFSSPRYGAQSMNDTYILIKNNTTNYIELYSVSNRSSVLTTFTSVGTSINSVAVGNTYSLLANTNYNSGTGIIYVVNNSTGALVSTISAQPNLGVGGTATVGWGEQIALNDTHCVVGTGIKGIVFQLSDGTEKGYFGGGKTFGGNSTHLVDINNNYVAVSKDGDVFLLNAQSSTFDYVRTISSHGDVNYGTTGAVKLNDTHVFVSGSAPGQGYLELNAHLQSNGNLIQTFNDIANPGANNSQFPGTFAVNNKYIAVSDVKSNTFTGKMYIIRKIGV